MITKEIEAMNIYLDNSCFNRPYDDQSDIRIKLETEAKLVVQEEIKNGGLKLYWSYILDFENKKNPFVERKIEIAKWRDLSEKSVTESEEILTVMDELVTTGLKPLDALHVSCARAMDCAYFLTVDKGILKKRTLINGLSILNPIDFVYILLER